MRRYGYTLKEAQEQQAYYIELQRQGWYQSAEPHSMSEKQVRRNDH